MICLPTANREKHKNSFNRCKIAALTVSRPAKSPLLPATVIISFSLKRAETVLCWRSFLPRSLSLSVPSSVSEACIKENRENEEATVHAETIGARSYFDFFAGFLRHVRDMAVQVTPNLVLPQKFERLRFDEEYVVSEFWGVLAFFENSCCED